MLSILVGAHFHLLETVGYVFLLLPHFTIVMVVEVGRTLFRINGAIVRIACAGLGNLFCMFDLLRRKTDLISGLRHLPQVQLLRARPGLMWGSSIHTSAVERRATHCLLLLSHAAHLFQVRYGIRTYIFASHLILRLLLSQTQLNAFSVLLGAHFWGDSLVQVLRVPRSLLI